MDTTINPFKNYKVTVRLYRITTIPTTELIAAVGEDPKEDIPSIGLDKLIKEKFRYFNPGFKIFYSTSVKTVVGMEAMVFDITTPSMAMAGLISSDPLNPIDVARIEGALEGELNKMGIGTNFQNYEWRVAYEWKFIGNKENENG